MHVIITPSYYGVNLTTNIYSPLQDYKAKSKNAVLKKYIEAQHKY